MPYKNNICKCGRTIPKRYNSTIQAKECVVCHNKKVINDAREAVSDTSGEKASKVSTEKKKSFKQPIKKPNYLRRADTYFSLLVRLTNCRVLNGEPFCKDIITGKLYHAKNIHNGHFISRANMNTRFDLDNCRPQNISSNKYRGEADKPKYERNLISEIGNERVQALKDRSHSSGKYGQLELKELADTFRAQVNQIAKERNIKKWW